MRKSQRKKLLSIISKIFENLVDKNSIKGVLGVLGARTGQKQVL